MSPERLSHDICMVAQRRSCTPGAGLTTLRASRARCSWSSIIPARRNPEAAELRSSTQPRIALVRSLLLTVCTCRVHSLASATTYLPATVVSRHVTNTHTFVSSGGITTHSSMAHHSSGTCTASSAMAAQIWSAAGSNHWHAEHTSHALEQQQRHTSDPEEQTRACSFVP
jgi:hypothetical protein